MKHEIILAPQAVEDLNRLRTVDRAAVRGAMILHLVHEPERVSRSRIKRLQGVSSPAYRLRVGEIRVFYDVAEGQVEVLAIVPKSGAGSWLQREGRLEP